MKSGKIIREARSTIALRLAWTQWAFARDAAGKVTSYDCAKAVSWCSIGAIMHVQHANNSKADAIYWLNKAMGEPFSYWQDRDERTHDEVLEAMDRAATLAETEGD